MQSGYNVYTLQQAARRSWRIGQKEAVGVHFFGYAETTQIASPGPTPQWFQCVVAVFSVVWGLVLIRVAGRSAA